MAENEEVGRSREEYFYGLEKPIISLTRINNLNVSKLLIIGQPITNLDGIDKLTNLSELWVVESSLKDTYGLGGCTQIRKLYLYSNQLRRFPDIKPLKKLHTLWIAGNLIDRIPDILPKELRDVNMADNNILSTEGFQRCQRLETLNFSGNPVKRFPDIEPLFGLTKLQNLIFVDQMYEPTPLSSLINYRSYIIRKMPHLKYLDNFKIEEDERENGKAYYMRKVRFYSVASAAAWNKYFNEKNQEILKSFNEMRDLKKKHYINALLDLKAEKEKDYKLKEECKKLRQQLDSASFNWELNHGRCNEALDKNHKIKLNLIEMELQSYGNVQFIEHKKDSKLLTILEDCLQNFICPFVQKQINLKCVKVDNVIQIAQAHHNSFEKLRRVFDLESCPEDHFFILQSPVAAVDLDEWPYDFIQNYLSPRPESDDSCWVTNSIGVADKDWLTANGIYKNILLTNEKKQGHRVLIMLYVFSLDELLSCTKEDLAASHLSDNDESKDVNCSCCKIYRTSISENVVPLFVTNYHYEYKDCEKINKKMEIPSGAIYENSSALSTVVENPKFDTVSWQGLISLSITKCRLSSFGPVAPIQSIQKLDVSYNKFSNIQEIFRIFPNLTSLHASFNEISNIASGNEMYALEEIDLQWNKLTFLYSALQNLNRFCPNLLTLNMNYNAFKDIYEKTHVDYFVRKLFPSLRRYNNEWMTSENVLNTYKLTLKELPMAYLSDSNLTKIKNPIKISWSAPICLKQTEYKPTSHVSINEQREITCVYLDNYISFHEVQFDFPKSSIRWLTIKNNHLTNLKFLTNITRVKEIDLSFNLLQKVGDIFLPMKHLVKLNLMGNYLTTLEGFKGADLPLLKVFNVSKNCLRCFSGVESLVNVEELYAASNDFKKWENLEFIREWKMLRVIDLSDNDINDPSMLKKFVLYHGSKVEYVNGSPVCDSDITAATNALSGLLDKDYLHKLHKPQELMHMTELTIKKVGLRQVSLGSIMTANLTSVNFERNNLTTLSPLSYIKSLKTLCLSHNQISSYGDGTENFEKLEVLYLNNNSINDLNSLELNRCPKLSTLFLHDNQITSLEGLRENTSLIHLIVDRNKLTEITANDFLSFFNLRDLYLESNQLKDLNFLKSLKSLKRLFVAFNKIQEPSTLENLAYVSKLKEMTCNGNPICRFNIHYTTIYNLLPRLVYIDGFIIEQHK